jgi:energy-converting hydrogenase A subunit M
MPQLDELANKICQAALEETWGQFEQERKRILRATLEEDTQYCYPTSVVCLLSLGFDEPYESLLNLLIDEGVRNRSNRTALFNRTLRYVGLASE